MQTGLIRGGPEHQGMALHQRVHRVVTAANHAGHRDVAAEAGIKDQVIALLQALIAEGQLAEAIVSVWIDAGVVEHQIRLLLIEQRRQHISHAL